MMDESLKEHFDSNCNHELLTREEEVALFKHLRAPCDSQGVSRSRQAYHKLWMCNQKLILSVVNRYKYRHPLVTDMELIQAGQIGLGVALRRFDHTRGYRLSTYATWWIRYYVLDVVVKGRPIPIPMEQYKLLGQIFAAESFFIVKKGRLPTASEIAARLGERVDVVEAVLRAAHVVEGDAPMDDRSMHLNPKYDREQRNSGAHATINDRLTDKSDMEADSDSAIIMEGVVNMIRTAPELSDCERTIALRYLGLAGHEPVSFQTIANEMNISVNIVRRLWARKVLPFLREHSYMKGLLDAYIGG